MSTVSAIRLPPAQAREDACRCWDRTQRDVATDGGCADQQCELMVVPGATHLFEEPGTLEEVAKLARDWFIDHLCHAATNR